MRRHSREKPGCPGLSCTMEPHAQPAPAPSPPPPRAPRAHPVLSVPEDTHALGHLGERERMLSAVSRARWPPADSVRDLRTPGGNPSPASPSDSPPRPLTAGVEGAAPPWNHLALHFESQLAHRRCLLAQAGIALWREWGEAVEPPQPSPWGRGAAGMPDPGISISGTHTLVYTPGAPAPRRPKAEAP